MRRRSSGSWMGMPPRNFHGDSKARSAGLTTGISLLGRDENVSDEKGQGRVGVFDSHQLVELDLQGLESVNEPESLGLNSRAQILISPVWKW